MSKAPPAAASGQTCRIIVPDAVPLILPSEILTMSLTPCFTNFLTVLSLPQYAWRSLLAILKEEYCPYLRLNHHHQFYSLNLQILKYLDHTFMNNSSLLAADCLIIMIWTNINFLIPLYSLSKTDFQLL